jgi:hypothetical protein
VTGTGPGSTPWYGGSRGAVRTVTATTAATPTSRAHQRQPGEGSDPVGVSRSTKPSRVDSRTQLEST